MVIKNFEQLAASPLRRQALRIAEAGLQAINTAKAFERWFVYDAKKDRLSILGKKYNLKTYRHIYAIAFGKAALEGISSASRILGQRLSSGFAIDVSDQPPDIPNIIFRTGTHPHPTEQNVKAAKELVEFLSRAKANDLVICLISGGGSALLCQPHSLDVSAQAAILKALMEAGADIFEMNTVRKHLSSVKGGQLAKIIYPAACLSLIFSDVPGDDLSTIASGPTVKDETKVREASNLLAKYQILQKLDMPSVKLVETPKADKYFRRTENLLFISAATALQAMQAKAEDLGFNIKIFSTRFQGEARTLAREIIAANQQSHQCLLGAGESTVTIVGQGLGGRNQEMALAALGSLADDQVLVCLASDGRDNTDAAGAIVDQSTLLRSKALDLDFAAFLNNNDSYNFFAAVGDQIITGHTGANVSDFFVCLRN